MKKITNGINGMLNKTAFQIKKHSPEILITVGIIGTIASAVMACKATTKINGILAESKEEMEKIHTCAEKPEMADKYTEEDKKKDLFIVYVHTGVNLAKLYAPAVILGAMSITSILTSNRILRQRNVAIAAAYAAVDRSYKEYRNRVLERFGEEVEHEIRYNIKAKEFEETTIDEKGEEKTEKKMVNVADPNICSDYARFFDDGCTGWEKDPEYNLMFLRAEQNYANDLLKARGHLFLNEVYDRLGIPRSKAGQVVGWVYDPENPVGDNFVDFGIYEFDREKNRDFVNGYEKAILLDFNVDGNVWDLM